MIISSKLTPTTMYFLLCFLPLPTRQYSCRIFNGLPDSTFSSEAGASNCNSRDYHAFEDIVKKSEGDDEDDYDYIVSNSELENCASD
ncbi:hypothetical protein AVEN_146227-1 [Araneus ventricosus]|uniref:Uncharacterized protein n=1 Tax=Araneus ventricosus TaxID=182803 RepID=A0A4Y2P112_ARAVE|nr:hypothetical protein AVEN_146227-1 [Araneus ventricosus]